jgi:DNA-binding transcriptional LysR family regulator
MFANIAPEIQVYVVVLAQEGSFLRAAQKLHTSQPFLTRRIAYLEKSIGAKLFDRTSRRLELTAAGKLFVPEAIASLNHAERAWDLARYQARIESGPLLSVTLRTFTVRYCQSSIIRISRGWKPLVSCWKGRTRRS